MRPPSGLREKGADMAVESDTTAPPGHGARPFPRATVILVAFAATLVSALALSQFRDILGPVLLTLVLSICAHPVRVRLERRGVPHGIATGSVILVVFALLAGFAYMLTIAFGQFASMLPDYADQLSAAGATIAGWLQSIGFGADQVQAVTSSFDPATILGFFTGLIGSVFSVTGALVIVLTMLIVMSADATYIPTVLQQLSRTKPDVVTALGGYARNVRRYMVVTTMLGIAQGVLSGLALVVMQVPAALLWGLLVFLCSFIPNIGYFFALVPPIVFGFLVGGWPLVIAVIVVYGVINSILQTVLQPRFVSSAVSLSQTLTFFSVLFWASILGSIGAILAIPLTLLVRTILIDADPAARLWRPAMGDISETRTLLKENDAAAKAARRARSGGRDDDGTPLRAHEPDVDAPNEPGRDG
ncbi:AI-2E family transporter [Plantibacter sp. Mn2098]